MEKSQGLKHGKEVNAIGKAAGALHKLQMITEEHIGRERWKGELERIKAKEKARVPPGLLYLFVGAAYTNSILSCASI